MKNPDQRDGNGKMRPAIPIPERMATTRVMDDIGNWTSLTPEVSAKYFEALRGGDWPFSCGARCGVTNRSVMGWITKGLDDLAIEPYASFVAEVLRIEAEVSAALVKVIMDAALGTTEPPMEGAPLPNPEHAKWLLAYRFRHFWGKLETLGAMRGVAVAEAVEAHMAGMDAAKRAKAQEVLRALPADAKAIARKSGFLITS